MGGNLFKTVRRHDDVEFKIKSKMVGDIFDNVGLPTYTIPYLSDKESHGDLDLIVCRQNFTKEHLYFITNRYEYAINGKQTTLSDVIHLDHFVNAIDTVSFNYDNLQVDLIFINEESLDFAIKYHSYNDLGGILGCCMKQLGFSLGREGLFIDYVPIDGHGAYPIFYTKNFAKVCKVFELDDSIYYGSNSLSNVVEMFEYLKNWKYFNSDWMNPKLMNATRRNRAAKRTIFKQITELANHCGGVHNITDIDDDFIDNFDQSYVDYQKEMAYNKSLEKVKRKESFSLKRMEKVLGYTPENYGKLFQTISLHYESVGMVVQDATIEMTDEEFEAMIQRHI